MKRMAAATVVVVMLIAFGAFAQAIVRPIETARFPQAGEMILVEAGSFQMGDEVGDLHPDTRPVHTVTITYDYWIGKEPVTFDAYEAFCDSTRNHPPQDWGWGRGINPIRSVNWLEAIEYCNWLSLMEGFRPAYDNRGNLLDYNGRNTTDITRVEGYRLPTEAEWEYAARGGHRSIANYLYSGSDEIDEVAWYDGNRDRDIDGQPIGQKMPNELGLYHMSGNVWEWTHNWHELYTSEPKTNPIGPSRGIERVVRGGSRSFGPRGSRVAFRGSLSQVSRHSTAGFRIVRTREIQLPSVLPKEIHFPCPNLEQLIRRRDAVPASGPIFLEDLLEITVLYVTGGKITSLEGMQYLTNLEWLDLGNCQIKDITPLQNLTKLVFLTFNMNQVQDISALADMTNLLYLGFSMNRVRDISVLANLSNLVYLDFSMNKVRDISALANLTNLQLLHCDNNQISDLTPLQNLTQLELLVISENQVKDITPLQNLISLCYVGMDNNQVSDLSPLLVNPLMGLAIHKHVARSEKNIFDIRWNRLDLTPGSQDMKDIQALIEHGWDLYYEPEN